MTNGVNYLGTIGSAGEVDTWTFTSTTQGTFIASVAELVRSPDTGFVPWVRVYDSIGTLLASDFGGLVGQGVVVNAPAGTYTITVESNITAAVGDYRLLVAHTRDPFAPAGDSGALTNGTNQEGRVDLGDLDIWTFTRQPGQGFVVSLAEDSVADDAGFVPWARVYDPNGVLIGSDYGGRTAQVVAGTALTPLTVGGTYTIIAGTLTAGGNSGRDGAADYLLRLAAVPGMLIVPPDDEGGAMTSGVNHTGRIELGDLDIWHFERLQTDGFLVSLSEATGADEPSFVPWIRVYDPSGAPVGNDYGARSALVAAGSTSLSTLPASGRYTVVVGSLAAAGNAGRDGVSDYTLRLVEVPGEPTVPTLDEGGAISNGVTRTARIDLGDLDPWTLHACVGQQLTVTVEEVAGPDLGLFPWVRLYDRTGALVNHNYGDGTVSVVYTPGLAGRYTVVVGTLMAAGNSGRDGIGDYTLRVTGVCSPPTANGDAYSTPFNTALVVPAPGVLSNDLSNGGGALSATAFSAVLPAGSGVLAPSANGSFTFTPAAAFAGVATFTYNASNVAGPGEAATVSINVGVAPPPRAENDTYSAAANTPLVIATPGVLGNDTSPNGSAMTATLTDPTDNGGITLNGNGSFTYTPNTGFVGADTFIYRVSNSSGPGNVAFVTINVGPIPPQPPTGFIAHSIAGNLVTLRWTPPATGPAPTGYIMDGGVVAGQVFASIPTGSRVPVFTFAAPTGAFYLRMRTVAGARTSLTSNEILIRVNQPVAPSAPSHLLGMVNGNAVALSWRPTFGGGAPSSYVLDVSGTFNASLPLGLTDSFVFNGVPNGSYTFRVRAVNAFGASGASNSVPLSFPSPCNGAPQTPADFLAYRVGNTVHLMWNPAAAGPAQTSFVLRVSGAFNLALPLPTRGLSAPVPPGSYTFSVSATNACGSSAATAPQTVVVP